MGEEKYHLLLIAPDLRMAYEVPVPAKELNRKVQAFRTVLKNPEADPRPLAKELYTLLLAPAAADLKALDARTLLWSLDGALRYVPVAALHDGEHYLVENYRSVLFTPASQARLKDKPKSAWKVLGLGVSREHEGFQPLPGVREELEEIVKVADGSRGVLPGIVGLDDGFTLAAMKDGLRQRYPVVHIASHFQFTPGDDAKSYLPPGRREISHAERSEDAEQPVRRRGPVDSFCLQYRCRRRQGGGVGSGSWPNGRGRRESSRRSGPWRTTARDSSCRASTGCMNRTN